MSVGLVATYSSKRRECVLKLPTDADCLAFVNAVISKMKDSHGRGIALRITVASK